MKLMILDVVHRQLIFLHHQVVHLHLRHLQAQVQTIAHQFQILIPIRAAFIPHHRVILHGLDREHGDHHSHDTGAQSLASSGQDRCIGPP